MKSFAQKLRKSSTDAELRLWFHLKNRNLGGFKFRRQHPIPPHTVDFVCIEQMLIVEADGGQHAENTARDAIRTSLLESKGYRVLRFWDDEVLKQTDAVLEAILLELNAYVLVGLEQTVGDAQSRSPKERPSPWPSPRERGEGRECAR